MDFLRADVSLASAYMNSYGDIAVTPFYSPASPEENARSRNTVPFVHVVCVRMEKFYVKIIL